MMTERLYILHTKTHLYMFGSDYFII